MIDPSTGVGYVNAIEIKLRARRRRQRGSRQAASRLCPGLYSSRTWRDKQGALLAAVQMETTILNILLFLIIAVAGFGILAIFFMIVVEKTRDIGILKSLGGVGPRHHGHLPGLRAVAGPGGLGRGPDPGAAVRASTSIQIADFLGRVTGRPVFNPEIYYFYRIPDDHRPGDGGLDRRRSVGHCHAGQRAAGASRGPTCILSRPCAMSEVVTVTPPIRLPTRNAARRGSACPGTRQADRRNCWPGSEENAIARARWKFRCSAASSLAVRQGEFLAIIGQSGSGKSTLLHLLGTLDRPDEGEIHFQGRRIDNIPSAQRDALRNRQFGMIFQFYHLLPELTTLGKCARPADDSPHGFLSYWRQRRQFRRLGCAIFWPRWASTIA